MRNGCQKTAVESSTLPGIVILREDRTFYARIGKRWLDLVH
jgi:hypothetical protein